MSAEEEAKLREAVKDAEEVMVDVQNHWLGDEAMEPCQICLKARTWIYFHGSDGCEGRNMRQPAVMTLDELTNYLRIHRSTAYRLIRRGELPCFRVGRDCKFLVASIDEWMKSQQVKSA